MKVKQTHDILGSSFTICADQHQELDEGRGEKVATKISGHNNRAVFDRYAMVDEQDVVEAMRRVQGKDLVSNCERSVKTES